MDTLFKVTKICGISLVSFSIFYYFVIFLPKNEKRKENQKSYEADLKSVVQGECVKRAENHAVDLYKSKIQSDPYLKGTYREGAYLQDDYEFSYKQCLSQAGLD